MADPRIVLAGSVTSSVRTLEGLIRNGAHVTGVLGLAESKSGSVSGYRRLERPAALAGIPYLDFEDINAEDVYGAVDAWAPDLLFAIGLSQMVKPRLLGLPRTGSVGFHPTWLPQGRGRAPLAWLVLDGVPGAATFFLMDADVDAGPILVQEPFCAGPGDYASDVEWNMLQAIDRALDRWIPRLRAGEWAGLPQDHERATYNGRRTPQDGLIHWDRPASEIYAMIRAASRPHPGAYTYIQGCRLTIWRATPVSAARYRGVAGRILDVNPDGHFLVQTGVGLILVEEYAVDEPAACASPRIRTGLKLGYEPQDEIHRLRQIVAGLERQVTELRRAMVPELTQ